MRIEEGRRKIVQGHLQPSRTFLIPSIVCAHTRWMLPGDAAHAVHSATPFRSRSRACLVHRRILVLIQLQFNRLQRVHILHTGAPRQQAATGHPATLPADRGACQQTGTETGELQHSPHGRLVTTTLLACCSAAAASMPLLLAASLQQCCSCHCCSRSRRSSEWAHRHCSSPAASNCVAGTSLLVAVHCRRWLQKCAACLLAQHTQRSGSKHAAA